MAGTRLRGVVGVVSLAGALLAGAIQVQAARERAYPTQAVTEDVVFITSGNAVRLVTSAFNGLAADVYWIRAIQYYGGIKRRLAERSIGPGPPPSLAAAGSTEYSQLYTLLDITTTLDPIFSIAYRFGAVFLAEPYPVGAGRVDLAVKLLEKGIAAQPDMWEYMEDIGFVYYWHSHDYRLAAAWFERASKIPNAPAWLKGLAATTLAKGGDRQSSRRMWREIRRSFQIEWMRATAERFLVQLDALDQMDAIRARLEALAQGRGAAASDWATVVRAGVFPGVPLDPTRTPYELTPDGRVQLSRSSTLFPLPAEPQQTSPAR